MKRKNILKNDFKKGEIVIHKTPQSFLFVYFLDKSNYFFRKSDERKINDNALIAND